MPDLLPGQGFHSVSTLESIQLHNSKIAHVQYANQANQSSFLDETIYSQHPNHRPPFSAHNAEYGHLSPLDRNGFRGDYSSHRPSQYSAVPISERNTFPSFELASPVSLSSSDSTSSASLSPPNSASFHHELSELGVSLSKLALHAEGAPIIVCEDGGPNLGRNVNSPFNNGHNTASSSRSHSRRKSYRLLHTLPAPGGGPFLFSDVDPYTCFSATSLSTAYHRYQQNVAYFYQHYPSLYQQASAGPHDSVTPSSHQAAQLTGQMLFHHHHVHHVHYHHHLHSKQQQQQLQDWQETGFEAEPTVLIGKSAFQSAQDDCTCDDTSPSGGKLGLSTAASGAAASAHEFSHPFSYEQTAHLLKGNDLVFHQAISLTSNDSASGRHFRPIGREAAVEAGKSALLLTGNQSPLDQADSFRSKGRLLRDLIDETSSLDSSLEDAPHSVYSSLSSSSCSSSTSSEPNMIPSRDCYCDVRPEVVNLQRSVRAISAPKFSPMCSSLTVDESSSSSSMPSSPSSFTSNSPLFCENHLGDLLPASLLPAPNVVDSSAQCVDYSPNMKLPRPIKSRKRRKKDKSIAVIRRIAAAPSAASCSFDIVSANHFCQDSSPKEFKCSTTERNYI